jgi:hypothetical protein
MSLVNSIGGISVIIAVLAFLLSVFNFIQGNVIRRRDLFEGRWMRLMDRVNALSYSKTFAANSITSLSYFLQYEKVPPANWQEARMALFSAVRREDVPKESPEELLPLLRLLAFLRKKTRFQRAFLDKTLRAYGNPNFCAHALYLSLQQSDREIFEFLVKSEVLDDYHIAYFKEAAAKILRLPVGEYPVRIQIRKRNPSPPRSMPGLFPKSYWPLILRSMVALELIREDSSGSILGILGNGELASTLRVRSRPRPWVDILRGSLR